MKTYLLRGVPRSLRQDGWWLDDVAPRARPRPKRRRATLWRAGLLAGLIALALITTRSAPGWGAVAAGLALPLAAGLKGGLPKRPRRA